jgi:hypothetical protein
MGKWTDDPHVECACGARFRLVDAFELRIGSEIECSKCGATLECVNEDVSRTWEWSVRAPRT